MLPEKLSPETRHPILAQAKADTRSLNKGQIIPLLISILATFLTVRPESLTAMFALRFVLILLGWWATMNVIIFAFNYVVRAPRHLLALERLRNADLERQIASLSRSLTIRIREAHITPIHSQAAHCFVNLTVFSSSEIPTKIQDYRMKLLIGDGEFEGELDSVSGYVITDNDGWDDGGEYYWAEKSREQLDDLALIIKEGPPLMKGPHVEGWLHFRFNRLPKWTEHRESRGTGKADYDEEGNFIGEIMDTRVYHTTETLTGIQLILMDSGGIEHPSPTNLPKRKVLRFIKKANLPKTVLDSDYLL